MRLGERRLHARIEIRRPHVGVLIEGAADGQQQAVEGDVVGDLGMAHGAQQDGVAGLQEVDGAGGHHASPAAVVRRSPFEILKHEGHVLAAAGAIEHAAGLRNHLRAHAIARDHCNGESLHCSRDNLRMRVHTAERSPHRGGTENAEVSRRKTLNIFSALRSVFSAAPR